MVCLQESRRFGLFPQISTDIMIVMVIFPLTESVVMFEKEQRAEKIANDNSIFAVQRLISKSTIAY